jgi:hypothetical protein
MGQKSAVHELIHRTLSLLCDLMNVLAKTPQDNDLCLSPGLFLPGLQFDKLNGIQVDR